MSSVENVSLTAQFNDQLTAGYNRMVATVDKGAAAVATAEKRAAAGFDAAAVAANKGSASIENSFKSTRAALDQYSRKVDAMAASSGQRFDQAGKAADDFGNKVARGARTAETGLARFGLSGDGVLQKLARSLSLTDLAAGAVFATIYAGQRILAESAKAYEKQQRDISAVTGVATPYVKALDDINASLEANKLAIGGNTSGWELAKKSMELYFTELIRRATEPSVQNAILLMGLTNPLSLPKALAATGFLRQQQQNQAKNQQPFQGQYGPVPLNLEDPNDNARWQALLADKRMRDALARSGGGTARGGDGSYSEPFGPQSEAQYTAAELARRRVEQQRRAEQERLDEMFGGRKLRYEESDYGPQSALPDFIDSRGKQRPYTDLLPSGEEKLSASQQKLVDVYNKTQKATDEYAAKLQKAAAIGQRFGDDVVGALADALFRGRNLMDGIKQAFFQMLEEMAKQALARSLGNVFGSFLQGLIPVPIPGGGSTLPSGRTVGVEPVPSYRGSDVEPSRASSRTVNFHAGSIVIQSPTSDTRLAAAQNTRLSPTERQAAVEAFIDEMVIPHLNTASNLGRY